VTVSSNVIKTLEDRGWIEVIGHREAPGRPALFATTKAFLDDLGLRSLEELPVLEAGGQIPVEFELQFAEAARAVDQAATDRAPTDHAPTDIELNEPAPAAIEAGGATSEAADAEPSADPAASTPSPSASTSAQPSP
jgi:segregation and condensation protein B